MLKVRHKLFGSSGNSICVEFSVSYQSWLREAAVVMVPRELTVVMMRWMAAGEAEVGMMEAMDKT